MSELLAGKVQAGFGNASHWLKLFNTAHREKLGMPVFPGFAEHRTRSRVRLVCDRLRSSQNLVRPRGVWWRARHTAASLPTGESHRKAFLWTPTTAAKDRRDPWVVELVSDVNLRDQFGLHDGDVIEIRLPTSAKLSQP
jgi:CTP-dependent riboflavin kinase